VKADFQSEAIEILLVEDNPSDVRLVREAFREGKLRNNLSVMGDGEKAWAFLQKERDFSNAPHPDLILLDLNLPKMDGRELLSQIKESPRLRRIPVVILTTSKSEEDISKSYDLHANCYITKPVDLDQFIQVIQSIEHFWLGIVNLPPG
jgi:chemotaxis family two-component system response regulator Rcp1